MKYTKFYIGIFFVLCLQTFFVGASDDFFESLDDFLADDSVVTTADSVDPVLKAQIDLIARKYIEDGTLYSKNPVSTEDLLQVPVRKRCLNDNHDSFENLNTADAIIAKIKAEKRACNRYHYQKYYAKNKEKIKKRQSEYYQAEAFKEKRQTEAFKIKQADANQKHRKKQEEMHQKNLTTNVQQVANVIDDNNSEEEAVIVKRKKKKGFAKTTSKSNKKIEEEEGLLDGLNDDFNDYDNLI